MGDEADLVYGQAQWARWLAEHTGAMDSPTRFRTLFSVMYARQRRVGHGNGRGPDACGRWMGINWIVTVREEGLGRESYTYEFASPFMHNPRSGS